MMNDAPAPPDKWDIALFVGGLAGLGIALSGISATLTMLVVSLGAGRMDDVMLAEYISVALLLTAACCLSVLLLGARRMFGRPHLPRHAPNRRLWLLVAAFPLGALLGGLAFEKDLAPFLLLPAAQLLTTIPPVVLAILLVRSSADFAPRRIWGQFAAGMLLVPLPAVALEMIGLAFVGAGVLVGLLMSSEGAMLLSQIAAAGSASPPPSVEQIEEVVSRLLQQPIVLAFGLSFIAGFVPLVEEAFKTLGVWPWLRRGLSPAEAFIGGAICGAGYGLFEALFLTRPGEEWLAMVIGRSGATMMHAFSAALGSWGLMEGVARRKWANALMGYGLAVLLHATWNAAAIWSGLRDVSRGLAGVADLTATSASMEAMPAAILVMLSFLALVGLPLTARRLRQAEAGAAPDPAGRASPPAA